jgi:dynein light chain roadblock-type
MCEIEQTLRRIEGNKRVLGTIVLDAENHVIHSMFKNDVPDRLAERMPVLIDRARSLVRDLDITNDLTFFRIRGDKTEVMAAPGDEYTLIVVNSALGVEN